MVETLQSPGGVDVGHSPKTYQDAIQTVRALGMRYLWIDALCIVQDDPEEWKIEANKMGDIYRNAKFTIAATSSIDTKDGFLSTRKHRYGPKISYDGPGTSQQSDCFYPDTTPLDMWSNVENTTWNSRGWTMQERVLSSNVIHFTQNPLVLECRAGAWVESHTANSTDWVAEPSEHSQS
jgi:hypothetical protein